MPFVVMMHECSPGDYTCRSFINEYCWFFGNVSTLYKSAIASRLARVASIHHANIGYNTLKHYAVLTGLTSVFDIAPAAPQVSDLILLVPQSRNPLTL